MDDTPTHGPEDAPTVEPRGLEASASVGPYRLVRMLGEGGMGDVWLADQIEPVRRRVALKVIKAGMDSKQVIARFEAERQALAMMDHRAIAAVFDAGTTSTGLPYFVMEYIQGVPITEHCDRLKLSNRERLELFVQVCEGVQHAHQKAVIHRDLKPTNVLVTVQDGRAVPKIIDFGVAKATALRLTEKTMYTELGALIGTPEYMSPEQAGATGDDVDTRTDVYSLGVLLYELLVGELPFDMRELRSGGFVGIVQKLKEEEPPRPSVRLSTLGKRSTDSARKRSVDLRTLRSQLRGDLDWIVMKAIEKDRQRRYDAPAELAADIKRHLNDEAVLAGAPSAAYRASKFVKRHRVGVGIAAIVVFGLLAFAVTMGVQARRIAAERDRADQARETSEKVSTFLAKTLSSVKPKDLGAALWKNLHDSVAEAKRKSGASPAAVDTALAELDQTLAGVNATGVAVTVLDEQILARAAQRVEKDLEGQPLIAGRLEYTLSETYRKLGLNARAESHALRAVDLRMKALGPESRDTMDAQNLLSTVYVGQGRYPEAEKLMRSTLDTQRRVFGADDADTLTSMTNLASVLFTQGRYPDAEKIWKEALPLSRRVYGEDHKTTLAMLGNLAACTLAQGRNEEAVPLLEETLASRRRVSGPEDPETLVVMGNLALVYANLGRHADAEKLLKETFEVEQRVLGPSHPYTLATMGNLAVEYGVGGHWAAAEKLQSERLDLQRRAQGDDHPDTLSTMSELARATGKVGRRDEAEKLFATALAGQRRVLGADNPATSETLFAMARFAAENGDRKGALASLAQFAEHPTHAADELESADELKPLHGDPAFEALVKKLRDEAKTP